MTSRITNQIKRFEANVFFRFHETDLSYIKRRRQAIQIDLYNTTEKYENQRQKTCQSECRQKPQIMTTSSVLKLTSVKKSSKRWPQ